MSKMNWSLPVTVTLPSGEYVIHSDYRDILDIIAHLQDPEDTEEERLYIGLRLFYEDFPLIPTTEWTDAAKAMMAFINCGKATEDEPLAPKLVDWEQDAPIIVADINKVAGYEIRALDYLHWWTFIAYFHGIGDGQLALIVSIRQKLRKGQALEKWEREFYRENRSRIDLRCRYTAEEQAEMDKLNKLLGD